MMQHGPLRRSDSVRSAATIHMGGGVGGSGRPKENGMLRKSKTELIITTKNAAVVEANKEMPKSVTGDLKPNSVDGEQSNCVLM